MATQQPGWKNLSVLSKGVERPRVIAELGSPLTTEVVDGKKQDVFAFQQGDSGGLLAESINRPVFHGLVDVCALGRWEVVGTRMEAALSHRSEVEVRVFYDKDDKVESILPYSGKELLLLP